MAVRERFLVDGVRRLGATTVFLGRLLAQCLPALARPRLIIAQVYNTGARSLIIIMLSGLFVGMVLGLQGYDLATLWLRRRTGERGRPVRCASSAGDHGAAVFAGRAGTSLTSEIGLMRATDQPHRHGDHGGRSAALAAPRFSAGCWRCRP
jgi:phospholipid/cholesterol/gamma-HCH transport system permease protein